MQIVKYLKPLKIIRRDFDKADRLTSKHLNLIGLALLSSLSLVFLGVGEAHALIDDTNLSSSINSAIIAIREADSVGADTSDLTSRLNNALEEAQSLGPDSCGSSDECTNNLNEIVKSIANDAKILKDNANVASNIQIVIATACAIAGAFAGSYFAIYCYSWWKSSQLRRFLDMEIEAEN